MKTTKKRALYIIAALLAALFVLSCLVGFAACGGGSGDDEKKDTPTEQTATVSSVSISSSSLSLKMGSNESGTLTATVKMSDGTNSSSQTVKWTSSDTSVATVSATGYTATVTAKKAGTTNITASVGSVTSAACVVTVVAADVEPEPEPEPEPTPTVSSVSLSQSSLAFEYSEAKEASLTATVTMSDGGEYDGDYAWTSSDDTVAKVETDKADASKATVTAVKCGETTITVSVGEDDNVEKATCTVTVSEDHAAAEAARIIGSAEAAEGYHFTFDDADAVAANQAVLFNDSAVHSSYDASAKTYTLSGASAKMTSEQANAFWGDTDGSGHVGHEYIGFIVNVNAGETVKVESYSSEEAGAAADKTFTFTSPDEDTAFLVDIEDHDSDGAWYNVLTVTYAGGDVEIYTVVLGDVEPGVSSEEDLKTAILNGGEVALTDDIELSSSLAIGSSGGTGDPVEVTLDLNECSISSSNTSSQKQNSTIIVEANATLTVIDSGDGSGAVDATANDTAALFNNGGTVTIAGGTFERTQENGMKETKGDNQNSYYTVLNYCGDMTIEDGAVIFNSGDYSTCLKSSSEDPDNPATLTINGGKIYGGKFAVKNDYSGILTINGGEIGGLRSEDDALPYRALDNYDQATITGGTLRGGNGGAVEVSDTVDGAVAEGLVIYNNTTEQSATDRQHGVYRGDEIGSLTIGDEEGNGPEIIYEGINPNAAVADNYSISYYDEDSTPAFATGIAIESGTVNFIEGTIECSDATENGDYGFMGVYLTSGTLNVSGGSISGDVAIAIDCTGDDAEIEFSITGGQLGGDIIVYFTDENGDVVASVYTPGRVIVPSESFAFNNGTFNGFSGLDQTFTGTNGVEYVAGDIAISETANSGGTIYVVVDGIVANMMNSAQKAAFSSEISEDDMQVRFYIAVQIAVQPGETVTVTSSNGKTDTIYNDTDEVRYILWVIQVNSDGYDLNNPPTLDYAVVTMGIKFSVSVTNAESNTSSYEISIGNVYLPKAAWECAKDNHTVTQWTVVEEETCGTAGSQTGICDICGEEVTETIEATGNHSWNDGEVTTAATCTTEGVMTKTCTVCGETKTEPISATGHAAKEYDDGKLYAVYCADNEAWYALCETCNQWFEIEGEYSDYDIYDFVLVAKDEASLDAALTLAGERTDGSEEVRTQILVYGEIKISDTSYVLIDCDNVEIYGLGVESSKIIDSAYVTSNPARDGVEITGKNVTIRDLTIDGSKLDEVSEHVQYEHGLEIRESASNVTLSNCVIIGGTSSNSSAVVLMGGNETGYLLIENCTLSGYHGIEIEHDGADLAVTISGGTLDGAYGILIDAGIGVTLVVENVKVYGQNSTTTSTTSVTFTNCTFGYHSDGTLAYGLVNAYCDVTLKDCTFLANDTQAAGKKYAPYGNSENYVIQARTAGITITIIDCKFDNTNDDLESGTISLTADTVIYVMGIDSKVTSCLLRFSDAEDAWEYLYDATAHTVEHNHNWVVVSADDTTSSYKCYECGAEKTEITVDHVVSATPSVEYVVTTVGEENFEAPAFAVTMSEGAVYDSIGEYLAVYTADSVTWSSDNTDVATIDATSGEITIVGAGEATITVTFTFTSFTASYMLCVGEAITDTDPLIDSWHGTDKVTASASFISLNLTVEVYATVTEEGFTLRVVEETLNVEVTIWENVAWFKANGEYYIVVEEADGSYETIDISYDTNNDQLSTSFEFSFEYTVPLIGSKMDVTVDVQNATLDRVTADGGDTEPDNQNP